MAHVFEVDDQDIEHLDDKQLTALLRKLLVLEARRRGITAAAVQVSLKIDAPDGGEDGRIEWQGGADADPDGWLPSRNTLYQVKATKLGPTTAGNEVLQSKSTTADSTDTANGGASQQLKPRVAATVSAGGAYVLFYGKQCTKDMEAKWIAKIRASFVASDVPNGDNASIRIFDRGRIATWANQHAAAVTYVLEKVGKAPPIGAMGWETWQGYADLQGSFVWDPDRTSYVESLRDLLRVPRKVARLVGLSGRGKTRLALETLRCPDAPDDDAEQYALSTSAVYVIADQVPNLPAEIRAWRARGQEGVLVVDECSLDNHTDLAREVEHSGSRFSLLTIDYDPDSRPDGSTPVIELGALPDDGIKEIVGAGRTALGAGVLARFASFAQGFPRIAVLLREFDLGDGHVRPLDDAQLAKRLVWGRGTADAKALRVIQACSLFEHFGIDGRAQHEAEFIAQKMCGLPTDEFRGLCQTFLSRKILYRRGDYVRVTPPPLAMHLAGQWFDGTPVDDVVHLLTKQLPHGMIDAMGRQLRNLHFHPTAKKVVEELCGPTGPFSRREFLDSSAGSRLVSSLAEIHPAAVVDALDRVFGTLTPDQIREVGEGRRDLVWTLQKLAWWPESFRRSARLLLLFAAGENESWGNNATNQFAQLFHLYLSGTQAPALDRIPLLDEALDSGDPNKRQVAIKAMRSALTAQHFTRTGGVEAQGSRVPQEDWQPRTGGDIQQYWEAVFDRLVPIACTDTEEGLVARKALAEQARGVIGKGGLEMVGAAIERVLATTEEPWPEMDDALRIVLRFEGRQAPADVRQRLDDLLALLAPQDMRARIEMLVRSPSFADMEKGEDGHYINHADERARAFARECGKAVGELDDYLNLLVSGEIRAWHAFGFELGRVVNEREPLFANLLVRLKAQPLELRNASVVSAFLGGAATKDRDFVSKALDRVTNDDQLVPYLAEFSSLIQPQPEDLDRLVHAVRDKRLHPRALSSLGGGALLSNLAQREICKFALSVANLGPDAAAVVSDILVMYTWNEDAKLQACQPTMRSILARDGVYAAWTGLGSNSDFHVEHTATQLLELEPPAGEFAVTLGKQVVEVLDRGVLEIPRSATSILAKLLERHFSAAWPLVKHTLLDGSHNQQDVLLDRLREDDDPRLGNRPLVGLRRFVPEEELAKWMSEDARAVPLVSRMCDPLTDSSGTPPYPSWSPLAISLLNDFGGDDEVRSNLSQNIHTRGWTGSAVPGIDDRITAFEELLEHPSGEVRAWASEEVNWLRKSREQWAKRDEERDFGIFR